MNGVDLIFARRAVGAVFTRRKLINARRAIIEKEETIARHGDRIAVGLDVRGTTLAARGWTREGGDLWETLDRLDRDGCARFVVTDVTKDGTLRGPNLDLLRGVCARTDRPVVASGGIVIRGGVTRKVQIKMPAGAFKAVTFAIAFLVYMHGMPAGS